MAKRGEDRFTGVAGPGYDAYRTTAHFAGLNGVRCLAVVAVIWHHCHHGGVQLLGRGFLGVDLFFVLSGFLIATLLLRERDATGSIALGKFWLRRCLRLMPALYLLIGLLTLYYALHPASAHADIFFRSLPANALYYSNWAPRQTGVPGLWSLATEEQFYLIWPLIERFAAALAWPLLALAMLANQALNFGLLDSWLGGLLAEPPAGYEIVAATYMPICLGILIARLLHHRRGHAMLRGTLGRAAAPWLILGLLLLVAGWGPLDMRGWPRPAAQLLMALLIAAIVLRPAGLATRLLEWRPVVRIGSISYGLYLYHLWANQGAWKVASWIGRGPDLLLFALTLALSIVVAEISYRWVEAPLLRLGHRFRAPRGALAGDSGQAPS